jgi:hypothetical protein
MSFTFFMATTFLRGPLRLCAAGKCLTPKVSIVEEYPHVSFILSPVEQYSVLSKRHKFFTLIEYNQKRYIPWKSKKQSPLLQRARRVHVPPNRLHQEATQLHPGNLLRKRRPRKMRLTIHQRNRPNQQLPAVLQTLMSRRKG